MKRIIETSNEGMEALLGEHIFIHGTNYHYSGTLVGVNEHDIILESAHLVFETGPYTTPGFKDAQPLPGDEWRVKTAAIESYGVWPL